ncbi:hypothetical protein [Streptomyces sp. NPDC087787]|uniref:hypothetical protein n=1 Tax=Streptomyces sp. NPDC087787 TaxID=3365803 RepID=UPI003817DC18
MAEVQRMSRAYFDAEFGWHAREHVSEIAPVVREKTPAFLVWPELLISEDGDQ